MLDEDWTSRICAAPTARLSHLPLESDQAFPTQF